MSGPPKLPPQLKLLRGTAAKDRHRKPRVAPTLSVPPFDGPPTPPEWLKDREALAQWHRLVPLMLANNLLHAANVTMLAHLCATHGSLVKVWAAGGQPTAALLGAYRATAHSLGLVECMLESPKPNNRFAANAAARDKP